MTSTICAKGFANVSFVHKVRRFRQATTLPQKTRLSLQVVLLKDDAELSSTVTTISQQGRCYNTKH